MVVERMYKRTIRSLALMARSRPFLWRRRVLMAGPWVTFEICWICGMLLSWLVFLVNDMNWNELIISPPAYEH